jgi:hypothetical protein
MKEICFTYDWIEAYGAAVISEISTEPEHPGIFFDQSRAAANSR